MLDRSVHAFPLALLALLAGVSVWLDRVSRVDTPQLASRASQQPDVRISRFDARRMDERGQVWQRIEAERFEHVPLTAAATDDLSYLTRVRYTQTLAPHPAWQVSAPQARMLGQGEELGFAGAVSLWRAGVGTQPPLTLTASAVTVRPQEGVARGRGGVEFRQGNLHIAAQTFDFNNQTRVIQLAQRVRATYDKPQ
jgi:lipopolysaccharide export system protein LptC